MTRDTAATAGATAGSRRPRASRRIIRTTSLSAPYGLFGGIRHALARRWSTLSVSDVPRGVGSTAAALVLLASVGFGVVRGGHLPVISGVVTDACHRVANAAGFRIASIALVEPLLVLAFELVVERDVVDPIAAFKKPIDLVQVRLEDLRVVLQFARFDEACVELLMPLVLARIMFPRIVIALVSVCLQ